MTGDDAVFTFRLKRAELDRMRELAHGQGMTLAEYLRTCARLPLRPPTQWGMTLCMHQTTTSLWPYPVWSVGPRYELEVRVSGREA